MLVLTGIIDSLAAADATAASVARSIGTLGERQASEYRVLPANRDLGEVRLGTRMSGERASTPPYLQMYLPAAPAWRLRDLQPQCSTWVKVPGNPAASPFRVGCHLPTRSGVQINLVAVLSGPQEAGDSYIRELLLQRAD